MLCVFIGSQIIIIIIINLSGRSFICELGRRIAAISGDLRATAFYTNVYPSLFDVLDAVAFRGCFYTADLD